MKWVAKPANLRTGIDYLIVAREVRRTMRAKKRPARSGGGGAGGVSGGAAGGVLGSLRRSTRPEKADGGCHVDSPGFSPGTS